MTSQPKIEIFLEAVYVDALRKAVQK